MDDDQTLVDAVGDELAPLPTFFRGDHRDLVLGMLPSIVPHYRQYVQRAPRIQEWFAGYMADLNRGAWSG